MGRDEGLHRLAGTLLFLDGWGESDVSALPKLMPYDPPSLGPIGFGFCGPGIVLWRDKNTGLSRSKRLNTGVLAEIEAAWLRWLGHHDVRVRPLGGCGDDGLAGVAVKA